MAKKTMPTADNARSVPRPNQGPAKGPARKPGKTWSTGNPAWNGGKKSIPRTGM